MKKFLSWFLEHKFWAGITGVLTVGALVVAVIGLRDDNTPSPSGSSTTVVGSSCVAVGTEASNICNFPTPQSLGKVEVTKYLNNVWVVEDDPLSLSIPDDVLQGDRVTFCRRWDRWILTQKAWPLDPETLVHMESGQDDLVAVTEVNAEIFNARKLNEADVRLVACEGGGGMTTGINVSVHLGGPAEVSTLETDQPFLMPPTAITLSGRDYQGFAIKVQGEPLTLYEGQITIRYSINGQPAELHVGSQDQPLSWVPDVGDNAPLFSWSNLQRTWIPGWPQ